ncbi:MAG TPA: hypothetical protein VEH31_42865, partial [Streptosporangiaceae bacterium]|nr:hypothetical protein [Streptosporangiaceae bacterium]
PAVTVADVLATANHYLLDAITAPAVLLLAHAIAASPALARRLGLPPVWPRRSSGAVPGGAPLGRTPAGRPARRGAAVHGWNDPGVERP